MTIVPEWLRRIFDFSRCTWRGHKWRPYDGSFAKRLCTHCGQEQWLMVPRWSWQGGSEWKVMWDPKKEARMDRWLKKMIRKTTPK